jgi:hypothetical protein
MRLQDFMELHDRSLYSFPLDYFINNILKPKFRSLNTEKSAEEGKRGSIQPSLINAVIN